MEQKEIVETVKDHDKRLNKLEISDAAMSEQIKHLISELTNLTGWIKALILMIFGSLIGFVFWYIQTLK